MKAVLVDLDGTIIRGWMHVARFYAEFLKPRGFHMSAPDLFRSLNGGGPNDSFNSLQAHRPDRANRLDEAFKQEAIGNYKLIAAKVEIIPGMDHLFSALHGSKIPSAVVTNSQRSTMERKLEEIGYSGYFGDNAFAACDVERPKPELDLLFHAAERLNVAIEDCVLIGDSFADAVAGRTAGCRTIISTMDHPFYPRIGEELLEAGADQITHTSQELIEALGL